MQIKMMKKLSLFVLFLAVIATACNNGTSTKSADAAYDYQKAKVKEVLQASSYTYLRVEKNGDDLWIAVDKQEFQPGETVYFEGGLEMNDFKSSELDRTFKTIYFVQDISTQPIRHDQPGGTKMDMNYDEPQHPVITKVDVNVDQAEGIIPIGDLYAKKADYSGKTVKVKGQVTKVNSGIMGRNWVHIQDGTSSGDDFDLTVTTNDQPAVGDVVIYSGVIGVDKDFGAGYTYDLILENAQPVKDE